jgi:hypothetical protein
MRKSIFNLVNKEWKKFDPETIDRIHGSQKKTRAFIIGNKDFQKKNQFKSRIHCLIILHSIKKSKKKKNC